MAPMNITTGWVEPPTPITGLDHLGTQAPCIALYGQLLPGLTNVTDRARYYAFYPWLIREIDRRYPEHERAQLERVVRRAECLYCVIAAWHELETSGNQADHGAATVGRRKLLGAAGALRDGDVLRLEDYATRDSGNPLRYFKNPLGGLGQYYLGPLRELRLVGRTDDGSELIGYDKTHAIALADAFAKSVDADAFFRALEADTLAETDIQELTSFCPCQLRDSQPERDALIDVLFARTEPWTSSDDHRRRATFALLLDLADTESRPEAWGLHHLLRACTYSGTLPDGTAWTTTDGQTTTRDAWAVYARNDLLSVAAQGLFWATLEHIAAEHGGRASSATELANHAWLLASSELADWADSSVASFLAERQSKLPPLSDFTDAEHEVMRADRIVEAADPAATACDSIVLLADLLVRGVREYPYKDFDFDPAYFSSEDIHLLTLRDHADRWSEWTVQQWVRWLAVEWGLEHHFRVALRKLRYQGVDTFRIRPLDGGLLVIEPPAPGYTSPRARQATQFLRDLGLVSFDDDTPVLSDSGRELLEAFRDQ